MNKPQQKPKRLRLSPEERKALILEDAADFIRNHGVTPLSMDRLARESGHSKPLIYSYFNSRSGLLKALLERELAEREKADREAAASAKNLDELIRNSGRVLLDHVEKSGSVMQQLMLEPEIAAAQKEMRLETGRSYMSYLSKLVSEEYNIPMDVAPAILECVFGIGNAAGVRLNRTKADVDQLEDIILTLTKGALTAAGRKYGTKPRKK